MEKIYKHQHKEHKVRLTLSPDIFFGKHADEAHPHLKTDWADTELKESGVLSGTIFVDGMSGVRQLEFTAALILPKDKKQHDRWNQIQILGRVIGHETHDFTATPKTYKAVGKAVLKFAQENLQVHESGADKPTKHKQFSVPQQH